MSKRTLALIIVLIIITGALLMVALSSQRTQPSAPVATAPTPTTSPAHTTLAIVESATTTGALHKSLDVLVDTNGDKSTGVQLELQYDPAVVTNISITPGTFYADPFELLKNIDRKNGRITYAIAIKPNGTAHSGKGVVAVLHYDVVPGAVANQVAFTFLPKSKATAEGVAQSVLKSTTDYKISVPATITSQPQRAGY